MAQKISLMDNRPDVSGFTFREVVIGGVIQNYKIKDWLNATSAPSVSWDSSDDWSIGSMVFHNGTLYLCRDASVGAAVWLGYESVNAKKYVAILNQTGTNEPVATVLLNTL
ncbi:MAG: hypothetical protein WD512_19160, partial [Candidatus Paceibacterota bacterium]